MAIQYTPGDIRASAVLVRASTTKWGIVRQDKAAKDTVADAFDADPDWVKATKTLISEKSPQWKVVKKAFNLVNTTHNAYTGAWGTQRGDFRIITCEGLSRYITIMEEIKAKCDEVADNFAFVEYQALVDQARERHTGLGQMFDETLYPTAEEVREKFTVEIEQDTLPEDGDHLVLKLNQRQLKAIGDAREAKASARFDALATETEDTLRTALTKMAEAVSTYGDEGIKKPKNFKNTLVTNIVKAADTLRGLNVTGDPKLFALADQITEKLGGADVDQLRGQVKGDKRPVEMREADASKLREQVANDAAALVDDLSSVFG